MPTQKVKRWIEQIQRKKQNNEGQKAYYFDSESRKEVNGEIDTYSKGMIKTIKTNNSVQMYTNYFKMLVDEKIDYILAKKPTHEELPKPFNVRDILDTALLEASLDGVGWLHLYINDTGKLDWVMVPDNQIIPVYDKRGKYIVEIIRFWCLPDNKTIKAQVWTKNGVVKLDIKKDDKCNLVPDMSSINVKSHYETIIEYDNDPEEIKQFENFGFIPFIPLWNNKSHRSDLTNIADIIYYYNQISSGFIDNIFKFQEFIMVLTQLGGQDLKELMDKLQKYKSMALPEGSTAEYMKIDIPVEARSAILDILKKNLILLGKGVDLSDLVAVGSNITNVLITAAYSKLDSKANDTEKQMDLFYKELVEKINTYYNLSIDDEITFNRTQIFNESEKINDCKTSLDLVFAGTLSKRTLMSKNPYIDNVDDEIEQIEKEKADDDDYFNNNTNNSGEGDDVNNG